MAVVYTNNEVPSIEILCKVETEAEGWAIANAKNAENDGFTYWVEEA